MRAVIGSLVLGLVTPILAQEAAEVGERAADVGQLITIIGVIALIFWLVQFAAVLEIRKHLGGIHNTLYEMHKILYEFMQTCPRDEGRQ